MDYDKLTEQLWNAAMAAPANEKDSIWIANDLRVRIMALCEVVGRDAARKQLERDLRIVEQMYERDYMAVHNNDAEACLGDLLRRIKDDQ